MPSFCAHPDGNKQHLAHQGEGGEDGALAAAHTRREERNGDARDPVTEALKAAPLLLMSVVTVVEGVEVGRALGARGRATNPLTSTERLATWLVLCACLVACILFTKFLYVSGETSICKVQNCFTPPSSAIK